MYRAKICYEVIEPMSGLALRAFFMTSIICRCARSTGKINCSDMAFHLIEIFTFSVRRFLKSGTQQGGRTVAAALMVAACANPSFSQSPIPAEKAPAQAAPALKSQKFDDWCYRCTGAAACEVAQFAQVAKNVNVLTLAISNAPADSQHKASHGWR
jgi:hypothetical protein